MAAKGAERKKAGAATESARKVTESVKDATGRAAKSATQSGRKASATVKATRAANAGRVVDAKKIARQTDVAKPAEKAIAEAESLHYEAVVNKRGLSVAGLTKRLNERWENGWRLAHMLEQRGNTVLVFEKRT